jgi:hypothetical protein
LPVADVHPISAALLSYNGITENTNSLDLNLNHLARSERRDTSRRTGQDYIARLQRHDTGDIADQRRKIMDHVTRIAALPRLSVNSGDYVNAGGIEISLDPWAERTKGVKPLATCPLSIRTLEITGSDVVSTGKPEEIVPG